MYFVDQINLAASARRRIDHVVEQLTRIVDLGARGCVDFEQVDEAAGIDIRAGCAYAAGIRRLSALAVERLGEEARDRGLAHAARTGEQEGMVHAVGVERMAERSHD